MDYPQLLNAMMKAGHFKQAGLAKRLRTTQPTVSRWLKGAQPEVEHHERILSEARRLGVIQDDAASGQAEEAAASRMVKVVGYVGAGAEAHFYAVAQGDLEEVPAPDGTTEDTVAAEIRGTSLGPLFDRWLIFYDQVRRPVTADLIGCLCIVGLSDDRVLVKKIHRGRAGLYNLISNTEPPIENVAIDWAARVTNMKPR